MWMRFNPAKPVQTSAVQGPEFWTSPWSVVTEWWRPGGDQGAPVARTYRNGRQLMIEIDLPGEDPARLSLEAGPERLHLGCGDGREHTVPLPFVVDPESVSAEWRHGVLLVEARQGRRARRLPLA